MKHKQASQRNITSVSLLYTFFALVSHAGEYRTLEEAGLKNCKEITGSKGQDSTVELENFQKGHLNQEAFGSCYAASALAMVSYHCKQSGKQPALFKPSLLERLGTKPEGSQKPKAYEYPFSLTELVLLTNTGRFKEGGTPSWALQQVRANGYQLTLESCSNFVDYHSLCKRRGFFSDPNIKKLTRLVTDVQATVNLDEKEQKQKELRLVLNQTSKKKWKPKTVSEKLEEVLSQNESDFLEPLLSQDTCKKHQIQVAPFNIESRNVRGEDLGIYNQIESVIREKKTPVEVSFDGDKKYKVFTNFNSHPHSFLVKGAKKVNCDGKIVPLFLVHNSYGKSNSGWFLAEDFLSRIFSLSWISPCDSAEGSKNPCHPGILGGEGLKLHFTHDSDRNLARILASDPKLEKLKQTEAQELLSFAVGSGSLPWIEALEKKGARFQSMPKEDFNFYHAVSMGGSLDAFNYVHAKLRGQGINKPSSDGFTPISLALASGNLELAKRMKSLVPSQNLAFEKNVDQKGRTFYHYATGSEDPKMIAFVHNELKGALSNASINAKDHAGISPLEMAFDIGSIDLIKTLVSMGASVDQPFSNHKTARELLTLQGDQELLSIFTKK